MISCIGEIVEEVPVVAHHAKGKYIDEIFKEQSHLEGIVVTLHKKPVGLVMRGQFYQKIAMKFGFDVFMGRPIELIMNSKPLIVDYYMPITEVSSLAMERPQENLYDYVIVTRNDFLIGIVTIRKLLMKFAEIQVDNARYANPLTGLPGNNVIEEKISEAIKEQEYTVLYMDLDRFKTYNDTYGFQKGDLLIKETANILNKYLLLYEEKNSFLGHIGGDDFIAILHHYDFEPICEAIIKEFDKNIKQFYSQEDWIRGYVYAENRKGISENTPLVSISIAVVTNEFCEFTSVEDLSEASAQIKKKCKEIWKSCFYSNNITSSVG